MITFNQVTKTFDDQTTAVNNLTLTVEEGKLTTFIGPSGCGKTTTLKMINKLVLPSSGTIKIKEKDISNENDVELRRNIGYVIQRIGLFPHMTIEDNVGLVPKLKGQKKRDYHEKVNGLFDLAGLDPSIYRKRYPLELSGGQQQRIGVIRALAGEPPIILMDEPFSALDPISRVQLQDELKLLQKNIRKTIVFVTHDMDEALKISDQIVVMKDGKIEQTGTPEELIENPDSDFVRSFIGGNRMERKGRKHSDSVASIMAGTDTDIPPDLLSIPSESTLQDAARFMLDHQADLVLIKGDDGKPRGLLEKNSLLEVLAGLKEEAE